MSAYSNRAFDVIQSSASKTRRAYDADLRHFSAWGGQVPSHPRQIASYVRDCAEKKRLAISTIKRRLAAIAWAHRSIGGPDPTKADTVCKVMRRIECDRERAPKKIVPLHFSDIEKMGKVLLGRSRDRRDMALMLVGHFGGLGAAELVALRIEDTGFDAAGVTLGGGGQASHESGMGNRTRIWAREHRLCPVKALADWLMMMDRTKGPMFPSMSRHGKISGKALSEGSVARIVRKRAEASKVPPNGLSGYSIRAGFVAASRMNNEKPMPRLIRTDHGSIDVLKKYLKPLEA